MHKLNLKDRKQIVVPDSRESFKGELPGRKGAAKESRPRSGLLGVVEASLELVGRRTAERPARIHVVSRAGIAPVTRYSTRQVIEIQLDHKDQKAQNDSAA